MTIFRRVCIGLIIIGAWSIFTRHDASFDTVPFPAAGLTVKLIADVTADGDYFLEASMPKTNQDTALSEETVPCFLVVTVTRDDTPSITNEVAHYPVMPNMDSLEFSVTKVVVGI